MLSNAFVKYVIAVRFSNCFHLIIYPLSLKVRKRAMTDCIDRFIDKFQSFVCSDRHCSGIATVSQLISCCGHKLVLKSDVMLTLPNSLRRDISVEFSE